MNYRPQHASVNIKNIGTCFDKVSNTSSSLYQENDHHMLIWASSYISSKQR